MTSIPGGIGGGVWGGGVGWGGGPQPPTNHPPHKKAPPLSPLRNACHSQALAWETI
jgi:hypothetical protein